MSSTGVRFLHLANWLIAVFLAFVWMVQWDESSPLPVQASLTVTAWNGGTALDALRRETEGFAHEHAITFGQEVADFEQRHSIRNLYLVNGDPSVAGSDWLRGGYRDFTRSTRTRVHVFAEIGNRTPVGRYDVFGGGAKAGELRNFFISRGLAADLDEISMRGTVPGPVLLALYMMIFFSAVLVGAGILTGVRAYGVGRLHGLSYGGLLVTDLRLGAALWAVSGTVVATGTVVLLWLYNGLAAFGMFAAAALGLDLLLTAAVFAANSLVLLMVMQVGVRPALKGELPGRTASAMAYALRVCAIVVTVGTVTTALQVGKDLAARAVAYDGYERLGRISALSLGNAYTLDEQKRLAGAVGVWLRKQDRAGRMVLAGQERLRSQNPELSGYPVLYVNDAFLADQPVRLVNGRRYQATAAVPRLDVLIPTPLWSRGEDVVADLGTDTLVRQEAGGGGYRAVEVAAGQRFFTYSVPQAANAPLGSPLDGQSNATSPVIVVLPSAAGLLSDDGYTAFASAGQALFPDPRVVKDAVAGDQELQTYIRAVVPVAEQAAMERQEVARQLRLALLTAVIGMLVLVITGIGVVLIHARRNSQLIFARHVNGWRFLAVYRSLLTVEGVVLTALVALLPYRMWRQNQEIAVYRHAGAPLPFGSVSMASPQSAAVALLVAVMIGSVLVALARTHWRVVRNGASEV